MEEVFFYKDVRNLKKYSEIKKPISFKVLVIR